MVLVELRSNALVVKENELNWPNSATYRDKNSCRAQMYSPNFFKVLAPKPFAQCSLNFSEWQETL